MPLPRPVTTADTADASRILLRRLQGSLRTNWDEDRIYTDASIAKRIRKSRREWTDTDTTTRAAFPNIGVFAGDLAVEIIRVATGRNPMFVISSLDQLGLIGRNHPTDDDIHAGLALLDHGGWFDTIRENGLLPIVATLIEALGHERVDLMLRLGYTQAAFETVFNNPSTINIDALRTMAALRGIPTTVPATVPA